jgi:hypothetical protein
VRGSETDVLARFAAAAAAYPATHIVRLTADCPLIDPALIGDVVEHHVAYGFDYTSTTLLRTFPDGLDVEVMRADALADANAHAKTPGAREHVTPYLQRNPQRYRLGAYLGDRDLEDERWTIDTIADFAWLECALETLHDPAKMTWLDVLHRVGVQFRAPRGSPDLHVDRGTIPDPARRAWLVSVDGERVGRIAVQVMTGGVGTLDISDCSGVNKVALLHAVERRLSADLQVVQLFGCVDGWAMAFADAGYGATVDGSYVHVRLPHELCS